MSLTSEKTLTNENISTEKRKFDDNNEENSIVNKKINLQPEHTNNDNELNETSRNHNENINETITNNVPLSDNIKDNNNDNKDDDDVKNELNKPILFNGRDINTLSKSQLKKYKKMLSWESTKKQKRKEEKLRAKQRKIEAKKNNVDVGPSRKQLKQAKMSRSPCKMGVIIDLSFDELMIPKDLGKVVKQILRVYADNRRSQAPIQLHLCSFDGLVKEEMSKHSGYENWDCYFHEENYFDLFPKEKLVYLSSESDNVIKELEEDKMYIIGGLVDHNSHKGVCYKKAVEQGISHGQLPIGEFFECKRRKVFTINQVFEILLRVSEGMTFKEAFEKVLPQRINIIPTS